MGGGSYSYAAHRSIIKERKTKPIQQVFHATHVHKSMQPKGITVREACETEEHPRVLPILFALDVTGSMDTIPKKLATKTLPFFIRDVQRVVTSTPQVCFVAVGDANYDEGSIQVGQFETTAELMDSWLTKAYLEGGGGPYGQESYELVFYFAARHTRFDAFDKRKEKGFLFLTGDEQAYPHVSKRVVADVFGDTLDKDIPLKDIIKEAQEKYHVFFIAPDKKRWDNQRSYWQRLLGNAYVWAENPEQISELSAAIVSKVLTGKAPSKFRKQLKDIGLTTNDVEDDDTDDIQDMILNA